MITSNHKYPDQPRWIVQGTDAGVWMDSIWSAETHQEAQRIAEERQRAQGGQWRAALNKAFQFTTPTP